MSLKTQTKISNGTLSIPIVYQAKPKQQAFHDSKAKYKLYIGAWRAGKTYAGCQEAINQSRFYPNNCGVIFRKDYADLRDTTMKTFFEILPSDSSEVAVWNKSEHYLKLKNGSEVYFKYLKDGTKLGSLNLGWWFIDEAEEVTEEVFIYLKGRLSLKHAECRGWLVSNPPNTDHWLYKNFEEEKSFDTATFHASTYENKEFLPDGYISSLEKLPDSWRKKYLEGQYGFTPDGDPFYQGYNEKQHKRKLTYIKNRPIYRAWDYGYHHPACSFHQFDAKGRWLILREELGSGITIERFGEYIKARCREWYPDVDEWVDYGDPAGEQKTDKSEKTSIEILASMGIFVMSRQSTYRERKEIIERKLASLIDGIPSLCIDESCKTINDGFLGGYHYPVYKKGQAFDPRRFEVPYRDGFYEHLMNSVEYFAVNMFQGAETKDDNSDVTYRTVGDMQDVRFDTGVEDRYSIRYTEAMRIGNGS